MNSRPELPDAAAAVPELPAGTETVAVCVPDNAGRLIGKRLPADRWAAVLDRGLPMPDFHLVTGIGNVPQDGFQVTGVHRGYPNGLLRPCPDTLRPASWEPGTVLVLAAVQDSAGRPVAQAPRAILQRQLGRLDRLGRTATFASELEFYLFRTSYAEARALGALLPEPSYHRHADNDLLVAGYDEDFVSDVRHALAALRIPVDATQGEGGEGQHEINLRHTDPLRMADSHVYYKHAVKAIAHHRGQAVTFMAKISADAAGSSGHIHLCLYEPSGAPAFGVTDLSPLGRSFLAGLLACAPELALLHAPYANSYRRLGRVLSPRPTPPGAGTTAAAWSGCWAGGRRAGSSSGCPAPTRTHTTASPRSSPRVWPGSKASCSRRTRSPGTPTPSPPRPCPPTSPRPWPRSRPAT